MRLAEQDVVVAMFLIVEDCQQRFMPLFKNSEFSFWGSYLDVLPNETTPRLDIQLNDKNLEQTGRSSRLLLHKIYNGGDGMDSNEFTTIYCEGYGAPKDGSNAGSICDWLSLILQLLLHIP